MSQLMLAVIAVSTLAFAPRRKSDFNSVSSRSTRVKNSRVSESCKLSAIPEKV